VLVVQWQDLSQKLVLGMVDGLDDVLVVTREVEKAAALSRRAQFRQDILAGQRHQVVGGIEVEPCAQVTEHPRCIVLEFEVVFGGGDQFVAGSVGSQL
jgi:hypothetical protein